MQDDPIPFRQRLDNIAVHPVGIFPELHSVLRQVDSAWNMFGTINVTGDLDSDPSISSFTPVPRRNTSGVTCMIASDFRCSIHDPPSDGTAMVE